MRGKFWVESESTKGCFLFKYLFDMLYASTDKEICYMENVLENIGKRIAECRRSKGFTQDE